MILYFVSGQMQATLEALKKSAVAEVVADLLLPEQLVASVLNAGPGGMPGVLFTVPRLGQVADGFGYYKDNQEWHETPDGIWVGWPAGYQISAEDLERHRCPVSDFAVVRMADGSHWEVPVLRDPLVDHPDYGQIVALDSELHGTTLACTYFQKPSGQWVRQVSQRFVDLFAESQTWFRWLLESAEAGESGVSFGFAGVFDYAIRVLQLRYRYGRHLHAAVKGRWLETEQVSKVLSASCGWHIVQREMKKKSLMPNRA